MTPNINISPLFRQQFSENGAPLANGLLFSYAAGTTNKIVTYKDSSGTVPNTNPIVLDQNGSCDVFLDASETYKFTLSPPGDTDPPTNPYWTRDNISATPYVSGYMPAFDAGVVNACAVTLTPAPTALSAGMQVTVQSIVATNTGSATLNINGLGALPIQGAGGNALAGGELAAGFDAILMLNPAGTAWILIQTTGGALPVVAGTKPNHAINFSQLLAAGSQATLTASSTLTASAAGVSYIGSSATAFTTTLPAASALTAGKRVSFRNNGAGIQTIAVAGTDTIAVGTSSPTSIILSQGTDLLLESNGTNGWVVVAGSAALLYASTFAKSFATNGYQKLPSGLIIQWGSVNGVAGGSAGNATFPIAFPTAFLVAGATINNTGTNSGSMGAGVGSSTVTGMLVFNNGNQSATAVSWFALGY